jgi:trans-2-enoyl-CoA reductase
VPIAVLLQEFGTPPKLALEDLPSVSLPPDSLLLRMLFSPVNPADLNVLAGTYGALPKLPAIPGNEGVAEVLALGSDVQGFAIGDKVLPGGRGNWCSQKIVAARDCLKLHGDICAQQASMLGVNPPTAWALLNGMVELQPGDWVVQNAANSGVGRCVIQIARILGLRTLNVVRREKLVSELKQLGADVVVTDEVDLRKEGAALMQGSSARLALNAVGGMSALNLANALEPEGVHVTYGAMARQPLKIPNGLLIFQNLVFRGFWLSRWMDQCEPQVRQSIMNQLAGWVAEGRVQQPVHSVYPLSEFATALTEAAAGSRSGKILFDLRESASLDPS